MNPDPKSYILSASESQAIFEEQIVPAELGDLMNNTNTTGPQQRPLAVLIIGQTGAGKTRTAPALKTAMIDLRGNGLPPAHFIADTYKAYHPAYAHLVASARGDEKNPGLASRATGPDARRWLAMAVRRAVELRLDVLLESACRYEGDFAEFVGLFKEEDIDIGGDDGDGNGGNKNRGYRVEVALVAVPAALSLLGILTRFYAVQDLPGESGNGKLLPPRLTPRKVHDESYAGVLGAAAFIDSDGEGGGDASAGVVDQVVVVRRDSLVAYTNETVVVIEAAAGDGREARPGSVVEAVLAERQRPLTENERTVAEADVQRLRDMKIPGIDEQLGEVEALLRVLSSSGGGPEFPALKLWRLPNSRDRGADHGPDEDLEYSLKLGT